MKPHISHLAGSILFPAVADPRKDGLCTEVRTVPAIPQQEVREENRGESRQEVRCEGGQEVRRELRPELRQESRGEPRREIPPEAGGGFAVLLHRTTRPGEPLADDDRRRPGQMRRIVGACLRRQWLGSLVPDAQLLVTELTTNAFRHGTGRAVSVRMWRTDRQIRIEVGGGDPIAPEAAHPDEGELAENGRGLNLVAALAAAFGLSDDRTHVWCALDIPGEEH